MVLVVFTVLLFISIAVAVAVSQALQPCPSVQLGAPE